MTGESTPRRGTSGQITRGMYQGYYGSLPERGAPEAPAAAPAAAAPEPVAELPPTVVTARREPQRQRQAPRQQQPAQRWNEADVYDRAAKNIALGHAQVGGVAAGETVVVGPHRVAQGSPSNRPPLRTPTV